MCWQSHKMQFASLPWNGQFTSSYNNFQYGYPSVVHQCTYLIFKMHYSTPKASTVCNVKPAISQMECDVMFRGFPILLQNILWQIFDVIIRTAILLTNLNTLFWIWQCWCLKNWAASWQNQQNGMCAQRRLRSAWESAQSDQSLLCTQWVDEAPMFLHADSENWSHLVDAEADLSLYWAHRSFSWFCHEAAQLGLL